MHALSSPHSQPEPESIGSDIIYHWPLVRPGAGLIFSTDCPLDLMQLGWLSGTSFWARCISSVHRKTQWWPSFACCAYPSRPYGHYRKSKVLVSSRRSTPMLCVQTGHFTVDGASNNITMLRALQTELFARGIDFDAQDRYIWYDSCCVDPSLFHG